MTDSSRLRVGYDIDTPQLAAALRDLADGIESGELPVLSVESKTSGMASSEVEAIGVEFAVAEGYEHLQHPIQYDD